MDIGRLPCGQASSAFSKPGQDVVRLFNFRGGISARVAARLWLVSGVQRPAAGTSCKHRKTDNIVERPPADLHLNAIGLAKKPTAVLAPPFVRVFGVYPAALATHEATRSVSAVPKICVHVLPFFLGF